MAVLRKSGIKDSASDRMLMICIYVCLAILFLVLYPLLWVVSASVSDPFMIRQGKLWLMPVGFQLRGGINSHFRTVKYCWAIAIRCFI